MFKYLKKNKSWLVLLIIILSPFVLLSFISEKTNSKTLPIEISVSPVATATNTPSPTPTLLPTPTPTPTKTPKPLSKKLYKVAAIGDSMIETIGGNLDYIYKELKKKYPGVNFYMYNYGISSENVVEGLARFDKPFAHADRSYPSLAEVKPDLIIIGSYAYNPPQTDTKTTHFNSLSQLINKSKAITRNVYVLAEVAPLETDFGKGPGGVNWPDNLIKPHVAKILELMGNARSIPNTLGARLIDVYPKTTLPNSPYGDKKYVDPNDNIHPSVLGHTFMAHSVVSAIDLDNN